MEMRTNPPHPPAPFIFSMVNLWPEDMPLIPETCHTPQTDELRSNESGAVSCTLAASLAELVSSLDTHTTGCVLISKG